MPHLVIVLRDTLVHEECETEGNHGERPDDVHDRSGNDVLGRVETIKRISPVP